MLLPSWIYGIQIQETCSKLIIGIYKEPSQLPDTHYSCSDRKKSNCLLQTMFLSVLQLTSWWLRSGGQWSFSDTRGKWPCRRSEWTASALLKLLLERRGKNLDGFKKSRWKWIGVSKWKWYKIMQSVSYSFHCLLQYCLLAINDLQVLSTAQDWSGWESIISFEFSVFLCSCLECEGPMKILFRIWKR